MYRRLGPCALLFAHAALQACGGPPVESTVSDPNSPLLGPQAMAALNAEARAGAVTDELHGVQVEDPFRSLEQDTEATRRWASLQTAHSEAVIASWTRSRTRGRLTELLQIGSVGDAEAAGDLVFYRERQGRREQSALFVRDLSADIPPRELLDPTRFGERASLDYYAASPDGRLLAFGISERGDERSVLRLMNTATGELLSDEIPHAKWASVSWMPDASGFYYSRYPRPGEPDYSEREPDTYHSRVFFHEVGQPAERDVLVFAPEERTDFPSVSVMADAETLLVHIFRGWSSSDVLIARRAADATFVAPPVPVIAGRDALSTGTVVDGRLLVLTNLDAPRYRVAEVPLDEHGAPADPEGWSTLVPESEGTIEHWEVFGEALLIHYIEEVRSRLVRVSLSDGSMTDVALPSAGELGAIHSSHGASHAVFSFSGYTEPPGLYAIDANGARTTVVRIDAGLALGDFVVRTEHVTSADGTRVPLQLIHRRGLERNGSNPVILYGYGGFNVSLLPGFQRNIVYWLERGGVYAVANLRGGAEFGEEWHRAGNRENKERVFEDFEAALAWFSSSRISRPGRIAITGGSNGGLLMGAMLTRVPDRFAAAASYVGLYDMVRYHRFPPADIWVSEYLSSEDPEGFAVLHAYSPYHRVQNGTAYPAALIETADHDSRVYWGHSTKFAARLQTATSSDPAERPILFYMKRDQGHGAGTRLSDTVERYVRMYSFIERQLGM